MMKRVENVSFPRSGHSMVRDLLKAYFGPEFKYQPIWPGPGKFSEGFHFQKNHDFGMVTPISSDWNYLVLVRDPFDACLSWHKQGVEFDGSPDTWEKYQLMLRNAQEYWGNFVKKWVCSDIPNRLIVHYYDLLTDTVPTLINIVKLFGVEPSRTVAEAAVKSVGIIPRRAPVAYPSRCSVT